MTIRELINKLEEHANIIGENAPIYITGLYGAIDDLNDVKIVSNLNKGQVYIETGLFTG